MSMMASPLRNASSSVNQNYLKSYPYLFVRETDQTDYFCTLCDTYLKEEELQGHLFDGHSAETVENSFVRVATSSTTSEASTRSLFIQKKRYVYICVVCWAKIPDSRSTASHRQACKADPTPPSEDRADLIENGTSSAASGVPLSPPANIVSEPDIANILSNAANAFASASPSPNGSKSNSRGGDMSNGRNSPADLVIDLPDHPQFIPAPPGIIPPTTKSRSRSRSKNAATAAPVHHLPAFHFPQSIMNAAAAAAAAAAANQQQQCLQCPLCTMVVPCQGLNLHLREFHRITCSLGDVSCPLCLASVSLLDFSAHLTSAHGIVSQTAAASILFWVLSSNFSKTLPHPPPPNKPNVSLANFEFPGAATSPRANEPKIPSLQQQSFKQQPAAHNGNIVNNNKFIPNGSSAVPTLPTTVLQSLLSASGAAASISNAPTSIIQPKLAAVENIVSKFTRCHVAPNGKESIQCLICSKWFAIPPVKHLRGHMVSFKEEKTRVVPLIGGNGQVCIVCYDTFDDVNAANSHICGVRNLTVEPVKNNTNGGGNNNNNNGDNDCLPLGASASFEHADDIPTVVDQTVAQNHPTSSSSSSGTRKSTRTSPYHKITTTKAGVELDNAGRVKSGKVRKQCELCGEWSNIKWFFKHMSEVHQALFCRCCREYLPIHEQEEHRRWHAEPPYMGQKIRIEHGQPVIIDRKERASLTPIGSLAPWGGSSGGMVVKAVDTGPVRSNPKKRKSATNNNSEGAKRSNGSPKVQQQQQQPTQQQQQQQPLEGQQQLLGHMLDFDTAKDVLMPKETCPVCFIPITYKNLARHIKLRHNKIEYKFCYKCRRVVLESEAEEHREKCDGIAAADDDNEAIKGDAEADDSIDPTDFLETNSGEDDIAEDEDGTSPSKNEAFRATTSKNKLESLLGKEFKHPRRRCALCGYTVSYSNFKRHLRNAHPAHYQECEKNPSKFLDTLSHADDDVTDGGETLEFFDDEDVVDGFDDDDDDDDEAMRQLQDEGLSSNCRFCGDRIMTDFMERHVKMNHAKEASEGQENGGSKPDQKSSPGRGAEEKALDKLPVKDKKTPLSDEILKD